MKIAIHPDSATTFGETTSISGHAQRWMQRARDLKIETQLVDITSDDIFETLSSCDGLMWRFNASSVAESELAKNILVPTSTILRKPTYPCAGVVTTVDDKVAQEQALRAADLPRPRSWIFYDYLSAVTFLKYANYPLVFKLRSGAGGTNVLLLEDVEQATDLAKRMFTTGLGEAWQATGSAIRTWARLARQIGKGIAKKEPVRRWHIGYMYFQEFIPKNKFDIRATVIGERVFVFQRFNRVGDFRASGSGLIDYSESEFSEQAAKLANSAAKSLQMNVAAFDFLVNEAGLVIIEINSDFLISAVEKCSGHWLFEGEQKPEWCDSAIEPDSLIFDTFIGEIERKKGTL